MTTFFAPARFENNIRRMLQDFWTDEREVSLDAPAFTPVANVYEDKDAWHVSLDLPGLEKKDLELEVKEDRLTVRGERKNTVKREDAGYVRLESSFGRFERSWTLDGIDTEKIKAEHENGVLRITLPKREEIRRREEARKIEVK